MNTTNILKHKILKQKGKDWVLVCSHTQTMYLIFNEIYKPI